MKEGFLFGGLSPPNKITILCVLGASAVKILYWTSMRKKSPNLTVSGMKGRGQPRTMTLNPRNSMIKFLLIGGKHQ
jgi:hypothetical protein